METKTIIKATGLKKEYRVGEIVVQALKDASVEIERGEIVALSGPSGSGKSTLLHLLGLLEAPEAGEIHFNGAVMGSLSDKELANMRSQHLGFIFQSYNLVDVLTAEENVSLPLLLQKVPRKERLERAREILAEVGLSEHSLRYPGQLSGGQQQRVGIARALVSHPDLVIGDEITANLDSKTATSIMELLRKLNESSNTTFVFATHDHLLMNFVDRIIEVKDGEIVN